MPDLQAYITTINIALSPLDMEIRAHTHQTSRQRIHALINTISDPITQLATTYSADEMAYIKRVLDCMFETNNTGGKELCAVSAMQAVRLSKAERRQSGANSQSQSGQLSGTQAEHVLKALVDEGWFERSKKGWYSLSARALMELRGWLVECYNDEEEDEDGRRRPNRIKFCHGCKDMVTIGQRCSRKSCQCRLHDGCAEGVFRVVKARKCPVCKTEWSGKEFVGERAAIGDQGSTARRRSDGVSRDETQKRGAQRVREEEEEEEEGEEEDEGEEPEQDNRNGHRDKEDEEDEDEDEEEVRGTRTNTSRTNGARRVHESDDDDEEEEDDDE